MSDRKTESREQLMWKQTGLGARDFRLCAGDDLVGELYWPKLLSDCAVARCAAGKWHIDRVGFFRQRTVVTEVDSGAEVASFESDWLGDGDLVLADGRLFHWYATRALANSWALADEDDNVLLEIHEGTRWFKHEVGVVLHTNVKVCPELPLLIFVSWYLGYTKIQDAAAAVVATTTAVACIC
jgi:hypothetical protein